MEFFGEIGEVISFIFSSDAVGSGQTGQPEYAALFTYYLESVIADAELSDIEETLGKVERYGN